MIVRDAFDEPEWNVEQFGGLGLRVERLECGGGPRHRGRTAVLFGNDCQCCVDSLTPQADMRQSVTRDAATCATVGYRQTRRRSRPPPQEFHRFAADFPYIGRTRQPPASDHSNSVQKPVPAPRSPTPQPTRPAAHCHHSPLVPGVGFEPTRPFGQGGLSPPCLPISPPGRVKNIRLFASPAGQGEVPPADMCRSVTDDAARTSTAGLAGHRGTCCMRHDFGSAHDAC